MYLLCQSYEYIFPLTRFLLFTALASHSDHFVNEMIAKQQNSSGHDSFCTIKLDMIS